MASTEKTMGFTRKQFDNALMLVNDFQAKADANWKILTEQHGTRIDIDDAPMRKAAEAVTYYNGKVNAVCATLHVLGYPLTRVARKDGTHFYTYETAKHE